MGMNGEAHDHDWAQKRIAPFAAGLLDDLEEARFERHATGCAHCRGELDALRDPGENPGLHLPDRMISRWNEKKGSLRGLQRELVRRHLGRCDECQAVLRALGHDPVVERVAALEAAPKVMEMLDTPMPREVREPRRIIEPAFWRQNTFWMGSAFGGSLAVAAAIVLVVAPTWRQERLIGAPNVVESSPMSGGARGARLILVSGSASGTIHPSDASGAMRNIPGADTTIALQPGQSTIRIKPAPQTGQ